jgi:hypothetical protein
MDFVRSVDEIAGFIARVLRAELRSEEGEFFFRPPEAAARRELVISKDAIEGLITRIQTKSLSDETALYDETSFEVIVQEESPLPVRRLREDSLRVRDLESSLLFHLAYNLDIALVPIRFFEEISRRGRISRIRRSRVDELDPPRRTYNEDLVNHYILAVSTDSPTVQFLSHYHVLEHFFESVFNDDLIEQIKTAITHPGFSYKRKKDVSQLISTITKTLQIRSETITFSERDALRPVFFPGLWGQ